MPQFQLDENFENSAKIKVIGVGGAGGSALNRMVQSGLSGVEFIAINTDNQALEHSLADRKIAIGKELTNGLGAGANPEVGQQAIQEDRELVAESMKGADMVFITAGMGGGTGTGAAPVVAEIAKELGILSVGVVTRPFLFEGPVRLKNMKFGLNGLNENVDTIITLQNQKILSICEKKTTIQEGFKMADEVLAGAVRGISEIILKHGLIQLDFADVRSVMSNGGTALMGTGTGEGENRAMVAAERAIESPLLDDVNIMGARGLLVNITGGADLGIHEVNDIMSYIYEQVGEENSPNIIFGTVIDEDMDNTISVTVIATGFDKVKGAKSTARVAPVKKAEAPVEEKVVEEVKPVAQPVSQPAAQPVVQPVAQSVPEPIAVAAASVQESVPTVAPAETTPQQMEAPFAEVGVDVRNNPTQEVHVQSGQDAANLFREQTRSNSVVEPQQEQMIVESTPSEQDHYEEEEQDWDVPAFLRNQEL